MAIDISGIARAARSAAASTVSHVRRPEFMFGPLEPQRATMEAAGLVMSLPELVTAPASDGHPVLVIPGLSGGASWCFVLRTYLTMAGHNVHQPRKGVTKARLRTVVKSLSEHVEQLYAETGQTVSIIGWSIGGVLARQVAMDVPGAVRQVITLGAPAGGVWYAEIPGTADRPMPVPTTSIASKSDPWFDWRNCTQPPCPHCENVYIPSSHLGMATNSVAYSVILDRLGQQPGQWSPYRPRRWSMLHAQTETSAA